jgi:hypothetical protein
MRTKVLRKCSAVIFLSFMSSTRSYGAERLFNHGRPMGEKCTYYLDQPFYIDAYGKARLPYTEELDPRFIGPDAPDPRTVQNHLEAERRANETKKRKERAARHAAEIAAIEVNLSAKEAETLPVAREAQEVEPATLQVFKGKLVIFIAENRITEKQIAARIATLRWATLRDGANRFEITTEKTNQTEVSQFAAKKSRDGSLPQIEDYRVYADQGAAELAIEGLALFKKTLDQFPSITQTLKTQFSMTAVRASPLVFAIPGRPTLDFIKKGQLPDMSQAKAERAVKALNAAKEALASKGLLDFTYPNGLHVVIDNSSFMFDSLGNAYLSLPHFSR